jgi:ADP-heptose:LPS heptosyltransferase
MRILIIRTSAMGDVALTVPVLKGMREQYPEAELILLTRSAFRPFFSSIDGLKLFFPDFGKRHRGIQGLFVLFREITKQGSIDYVIDLHNVIRSKILRFFFRVSGVKVKIIDKGRREKKLLIEGKKKVQLRHSVERYQEVFEKAGFRITPPKGPWIRPPAEALNSAVNVSGITDGINIGVAPYAKHPLKMWPEEYMSKLLKMISAKVNAKFWLFGGQEESGRLISFQKKVQGAIYPGGKLNLDGELALMAKLSFMISMDSSNMHMAALTGVKVISIWGTTDPLAGFGAWMQPPEYSIRIPVDQLTCRPCTVYGAGKCWRGDHACMVWLTPVMVFKKMVELKILE